jgi:RNA recognition motif-containing protein
MDLFIGSIPFKFTEQNLIDIFSPFGEISSAQIVIDKKTRQNKGFGFVEMPKEAEAKKAMKELDGSDQMGRAIIVSVAQKNKDGVKAIQPPRDWKKGGTKKDNIITWG